MIGKRISALANSAALEGKTSAYLVWGVEDESHQLIGTSFDPDPQKVGNEALENWLLRSLTERLQQENLIAPNASGSWDILNLGALLFAKELSAFPTLSRKALRVIHYKGDNRLRRSTNR